MAAVCLTSPSSPHMSVVPQAAGLRRQLQIEIWGFHLNAQSPKVRGRGAGGGRSLCSLEARLIPLSAPAHTWPCPPVLCPCLTPHRSRWGSSFTSCAAERRPQLFLLLHAAAAPSLFPSFLELQDTSAQEEKYHLNLWGPCAPRCSMYRSEGARSHDSHCSLSPSTRPPPGLSL